MATAPFCASGSVPLYVSHAVRSSVSLSGVSAGAGEDLRHDVHVCLEEALANLIHPFWMLPLLGILGLKARDIVGYSMLQFVVHVPVVLFLVWILNYTLTYTAPVLP